MVILLGLAAAVLYGSGDFLGGLTTRKAPVLTVLMVAQTAGVATAVAAALLWPAATSLAGLAWGFGAGMIGGLGLIIFYIGLAAGPMAIVAPVSGLVATVLPVAVAVAEGERLGTAVYAGTFLCLVAIVLASSAPGARRSRHPGQPGPGRAFLYGVAAGAAFGLFFLLIRNAGQSGELWPVAAARIGELALILAVAAASGRGLQLRRSGWWLFLAPASAGLIDVVANICYVAATRTGTFGLAVVLASMYPGVTVLLARVVLRERLRWVQRIGLGLAAIGILLVAM